MGTLWLVEMDHWALLEHCYACYIRLVELSLAMLWHCGVALLSNQPSGLVTFLLIFTFYISKTQLHSERKWVYLMFVTSCDAQWRQINASPLTWTEDLIHLGLTSGLVSISSTEGGGGQTQGASLGTTASFRLCNVNLYQSSHPECHYSFFYCYQKYFKIFKKLLYKWGFDDLLINIKNFVIFYPLRHHVIIGQPLTGKEKLDNPKRCRISSHIYPSPLF